MASLWDGTTKAVPEPDAEFFEGESHGETEGAGETWEEVQPEEAPKSVFPRESAGDLLTLAWNGAGKGIAAFDRPAGVVMQLQSPLAGQQLDKLVAGTIADRFLQRLVSAQGSIESVGAIIAAPIMAALIGRQGARAAPLVNPFMGILIQSLSDMAPIIEEAQQKQKEQAAAVADLSKLFDLPKGVDPMESLFAHIFGGGADAESDGTATGETETSSAS